MDSQVAIVGMACRYPDAPTPERLWENVLASRRAFRRIPAERLRLADYLSADRNQPDSIYSTQAAVLEDFQFDREKFRVSGKTFRAVDMTHWLALDTASNALADAGYVDAGGLDLATTGVLIGNSLTGEFSRANLMRLRWPYVRRVVGDVLARHDVSVQERAAFWAELEATYKRPFPPVGDESLAGGLANTIAGRICNFYGFHGGGYTVDGACASSLLAVANACSALVAGDLDVALAGGVDLSLDPFELIGFAKLGALASDDMRVYDALSAGFWPGEGCGVVVLMRAADAIAQGRPIHAIIRGWGISSDGHGGITRPEFAGQQLALERAYRKAGFDASTVAYFEGHGTGTTVGDATELKVVAAARRAANPDAPPAAIGSIKANIGHTKAAAGVAGLIKATLAIRNQTLPPTTGWSTPHPELTSTGAPPALELLREGRVWPADRPLRAAVSAMGFGGINAHVVLEGAARQRRRQLDSTSRTLLASAQDAEMFVLAAADTTLLAAQVELLTRRADGISISEMGDLAAELSHQTRHEQARAAIVASKPEQFVESLRLLSTWLAAGVTQKIDLRAGVTLGCGTQQPNVGFLFPGQGSPTHADGGIWRRRFDTVDDLYLAVNLRGDSIATEVAQPAICTSSLAGLRLLEQFGIDAAVSIGHSLGELSAYCWAGVFDELTLVKVAEARGRAIADFGRPGGGMASIAASAGQVRALLLDESVVISGFNSPLQTIIAGPLKAIESAITNARAHGCAATLLSVSHAFHSPLVVEAAAALAEFLAKQTLGKPTRRVASTVAGRFLKGDDDLCELLSLQLNSPVRLIDAVQAARDGVDLWIEVGPGAVLTGIVGPQVDVPVVSIDAGAQSLRPLLTALAAAFALGVPLRHRELFAGRFTRPFDLHQAHTFLASPCEQALLEPDGAGLRRSPRQVEYFADAIPAAPPATKAPAISEDVPVLELVKRLVAARAELPLAVIRDDARLLGDLHLSSLAVGHLVAEAAKSLGLPAPASPTDYAQATIAQVADALESLAHTGHAKAAAASTPVVAGVDSWVRPFVVTWTERELPPQSHTTPTGKWEVFAPVDCELAQRLRRQVDRLPGAGVIVCVPDAPAEEHVPLLLSAARAVPRAGDDRYFVLVGPADCAGGFARTFHLENLDVTTCFVSAPTTHPHAADWLVAEIRAARGYVEANYDEAGVRRVPQWRVIEGRSQSETSAVAGLSLGHADVLLVSGGGKGIAAECALDLAKRTGVRLALVGRSRPDSDAELSANLRRMRSAGVLARYYAADVCDAAAVRQAVAEATADLGPISAILHGAGTNTPRLIRDLDEAAFVATQMPKLDGLRNLLAAVDPAEVRLLVNFGSIIARAGLPGEADYAVANEWLAVLADDWAQAHPHCRTLTIEWSVWSGVGMGERLGRIDSLTAQGISPITPDQGVAVLANLLTQHDLPSRVIVTGRFGNLPTVEVARPPLPLWRFLEKPRVHLPGVELVVDVDLSHEADPHIRDHVFQSTPLFAAVMGLEAMAQAALALSGAARVVAFEQVVFERPIVVTAGTTAPIRIAALQRAADCVDVVVRAAETDFAVDHFRAVCRVAHKQDALLVLGESELVEAVGGKQRLNLEPREDLYGGILFHQGQFCRIADYRALRARLCVATIAADDNARWYGAFHGDTLLLGDPGARDAAIHAIQACIPHGTILPIGVERITLGPAPLTAPCTVSAQEVKQSGGTFTYHLEIRSPDSQVCERWEGLRLRQVRTVVPAGPWAEPLLAAYVERQLAEIVPGVNTSIVLESQSALPVLGHQNGHANGSYANGKRNGHHKAHSDDAILLALGHAAEVHRRPDGKPEASTGVQVSVAHGGSCTLAVAAESRISCDLETVLERSENAWRGVLNADRMQLAERLAVDDGLSLDVAATRVWTALECLKKVGAPHDAPLTYRNDAADGWVVFGSRRLTIATMLAELRSSTKPVILAVLLEEASETSAPAVLNGQISRRREELSGT